jgi:hypothetical protein
MGAENPTPFATVLLVVRDDALFLWGKMPFRS